MHDDGVIKFDCQWDRGEPLLPEAIAPLMAWRDRLWEVGLVGVYPDGIGYGNVSLRLGADAFAISGTQTGHRSRTNARHYTCVDRWDVDRNWLHCTGPVKASSESLTHAALYHRWPDIRAIVHVHSAEIWRACRDRWPTTRATVPYGTPAMAYEMWRLMAETDLPERRALIMAGHEDGVLTFGADLAEAAQTAIALAEIAR